MSRLCISEKDILKRTDEQTPWRWAHTSLSQSRKEPAAVTWQAEGRERRVAEWSPDCMPKRSWSLVGEGSKSDSVPAPRGSQCSRMQSIGCSECGLRGLDLCLGGLLLKVAPEAGGSWKGVAGVRGPEAHGGNLPGWHVWLWRGRKAALGCCSSVTCPVTCGGCDCVATACFLLSFSPAQPCLPLSHASLC